MTFKRLAILTVAFATMVIGCENGPPGSTPTPTPSPTASPGAFCGGLAGVLCPAGQYCQFEIGVCGSGDQSGTCQPIPDVCTEVFAPVCGCDGNTYANACLAAVAGVSVDSNGACPSS